MPKIRQARAAGETDFAELMSNLTRLPEREQAAVRAFVYALTRPDEPDPVLPAFAAWQRSLLAAQNPALATVDDDDAARNAADLAESGDAVALAGTVPTTPAGLLALLKFALCVFLEPRHPSEWTGNPASAASWGDPVNFRGGGCNDGRDWFLLRSLLAGAERLAAEAGEPVIAAA